MPRWQVIDCLPDGRERFLGVPTDLATAEETLTHVTWAGRIKEIRPRRQRDRRARERRGSSSTPNDR